MKRLFGLALAGLLFFGVFSAPAVADHNVVKVWTQNLYLGADLTPLILAGTLEDFYDAAAAVLEQVAANFFPLRAQRIATVIALYQPDLIALQEVSNFTINGINSRPPFVNYLDEILDALAVRGQSYVVKAKVVNTDLSITLPFDITGDGDADSVRVVDRDVILVREGIMANPLTGLYTDGGLCGVPITLSHPVPPFPDRLQSTESEDGCNYTILAEVTSPFGPITINRGFVGVDATVRGKNYRFVNTHLEQMEPDPTDPNSAIFQYLQSVELVETLLATAPYMSPDRTLILLGDINSSPEDTSINSFDPPYQVIAGRGFADVWDTNPFKLFNPNGFTCCQLEDLSNTRSLLEERIDIIFVLDNSFLPLAFVTGQVPIFPLWLPLNWVSDHGGVYAKLIFR